MQVLNFLFWMGETAIFSVELFLLGDRNVFKYFSIFFVVNWNFLVCTLSYKNKELSRRLLFFLLACPRILIIGCNFLTLCGTQLINFGVSMIFTLAYLILICGEEEREEKEKEKEEKEEERIKCDCG